MGMLKSRADELERRLNQTREILKGSERSLEQLTTEIRLLAGDVEKVEGENVLLKKQIEEMEKRHAREIADLARQQK